MKYNLIEKKSIQYKQFECAINIMHLIWLYVLCGPKERENCNFIAMRLVDCVIITHCTLLRFHLFFSSLSQHSTFMTLSFIRYFSIRIHNIHFNMSSTIVTENSYNMRLIVKQTNNCASFQSHIFIL